MSSSNRRDSNRSFWDIPADSKIDILREGRHDQHLVDAINDLETCVEESPNDKYILYGKEQALLVDVSTLPYIVFMYVCHRILGLLNRNPQG